MRQRSAKTAATGSAAVTARLMREAERRGAAGGARGRRRRGRGRRGARRRPSWRWRRRRAPGPRRWRGSAATSARGSGGSGSASAARGRRGRRRRRPGRRRRTGRRGTRRGRRGRGAGRCQSALSAVWCRVANWLAAFQARFGATMSEGDERRRRAASRQAMRAEGRRSAARAAESGK